MGAGWKIAGKSETAAARGRIFTKLAREIIIAAKGGADLGGNPRLRAAVENAKKQSMPRDTIERAIKKGSGQLDEAANFETVEYEGFAPHRVPVIVNCLTDNRNRTAGNIRTLFRKGQLGSAGAVAWDFDRLGMIEASPGPDAQAGGDADAAAIEAGAQDLEAADDGATRFFSEPTDVDVVSKGLSAMGWVVTTAKIAWRAKNPVTLDEAAKAEVVAFLEALDEDDDVQDIYVGLA